MKVATVLYSEFLYVKKGRGYNQLLGFVVAAQVVSKLITHKLSLVVGGN